MNEVIKCVFLFFSFLSVFSFFLGLGYQRKKKEEGRTSLMSWLVRTSVNEESTGERIRRMSHAVEENRGIMYVLRIVETMGIQHICFCEGRTDGWTDRYICRKRRKKSKKS